MMLEQLIQLMGSSTIAGIEHWTYWAGVKIGNIIGLPIAREVLIGVLCLFLFALLVFKKFSLNGLIPGRATAKKKKILNWLVVFAIISLTVFFSLRRTRQYSHELSNAEVIISDFEDSTSTFNCFDISKKIVRGGSAKLQVFSIKHFDWPHAIYENSLLPELIDEHSKLRVVVGGICEVKDQQAFAQLEFKLLNAHDDLHDPRLKGQPILIEGGANSFKVEMELTEVISSALAAIEAAALECGRRCDTAAENYERIYNELPIKAGYEALGRFIALKVANIYFHTQKFSAAEAILQRQTTSYSGDSESLKALGDLYSLTGRYSEAAQTFTIFEQRFPSKKQQIADNFLNVLMLTGQNAKLDQFVSELGIQNIVSSPAGANAYAISLAKSGDLASAVEIVQKSLEKNPADYSLQKNLGEFFLQQGRSKDAISVLTNLSTKYPNDPAITLMIGLGYLNSNEPNSSLNFFDKSIQLNGDSRAQLLRARALSLSGRYSEATEQFLKAEQIVPRNSEYYLYRGDHLKTVGNCKDAIVEYKKGLKEKPRFTETLVGLSRCLDKAGKSQEKLKLLKELKRDTPAGSEINRKIDELKQPQFEQ